MKNILLILLIVLMAGCATEKITVKTPGSDEQQSKPLADYSNGSIWQATSNGVTEDFKARRRGDIITIVITETSSASKEAKTDTSRDSAISASIPNFMGLQNVGLIKNNLGDLSKMIDAKAGSSYAGAGSTSRQENLNATLTARVIDVLPNGNLRIEGRRNIRVNEEDQEIVLEGTVRPRDIGQNNTVNSIYVADAKISYSGRGIISDRQKPGWLMNIIDKVWPF
ncbi:MAG: flagellar basal body L-ring protein FlgH [Desulfuromonadaceae bacterium]|nr:flagellar basal body L-ring protein FlgH [Desulfuromonadaceae bacterium]